MNYKVIQVVPTQDYKVYIYFVDGKNKLFDAKQLITKELPVQTKSQTVELSICKT